MLADENSCALTSEEDEDSETKVPPSLTLVLVNGECSAAEGTNSNE